MATYYKPYVSIVIMAMWCNPLKRMIKFAIHQIVAFRTSNTNFLSDLFVDKISQFLSFGKMLVRSAVRVTIELVINALWVIHIEWSVMSIVMWQMLSEIINHDWCQQTASEVGKVVLKKKYFKKQWQLPSIPKTLIYMRRVFATRILWKNCY